MNDNINLEYYDDTGARDFIINNYPSEVLWAYDKLIPGAYKADLWRYCVLYINGGIYVDIKFIIDGGWHFSNIKTATEIEHKLKSYLHHREFDENPMSKKEIDEIIKNKQAIYDLKVDKRINKIGNGSKLENYSLNKLPKFLQANINNYKQWID